jgi:hypothetical protein
MTAKYLYAFVKYYYNMNFIKNMALKKHEALCIAAIFLILFCIYFLNFRIIMTGDTIPATVLPFNILENHDVIFDKMGNIAQFTGYYDRYGWSQWFFREMNGHVVSVYPIVTPVLITPLYVIPYLLMKWADVPISLYNPGFQLITFYMERLSASVVASLSFILVYLAVRELKSRKVAILAALTYALAMSTWSISSQELWQQGISSLLLAALIWLAFRNERIRSDRNILAMGVLSGLFIFNRPSDIALLLPVFWYIVTLKDRRILYYLGAVALFALPFLTYNLYYFGGLFGGYQSGGFAQFSLDLDALAGFLGLWISPNRGLFVYSPIALLAFIGLLRVPRLESRRVRTFIYLSVLSLVVFTAIYACYYNWWGGGSYGPRFLTSTLPVLAVLIGLSIPSLNLKSITKRQAMYVAVFLLLIIPSILIQAVGAYYYPRGGWDYSPVNIDDSTWRLWDIHDSQIIRNYNAGQMVTSDPQNDLETILDFKKLLFLDGWYNIEYWMEPPQITSSNRSSLTFYSDQGGDAEMNFHVSSFFHPRDLKIYQDGVLIYNDTIPQEGKLVRLPLKARAGRNLVEFVSDEPSQRAIDIPELKLSDRRNLSFDFSDISLA